MITKYSLVEVASEIKRRDFDRDNQAVGPFYTTNDSYDHLSEVFFSTREEAEEALKTKGPVFIRDTASPALIIEFFVREQTFEDAEHEADNEPIEDELIAGSDWQDAELFGKVYNRGWWFHPDETEPGFSFFGDR